MKRSKIFLAGTTCLLAIAGVAATKAHKVNQHPVYYTSSRGLCTAFKLTHCTVNGGPNICKTGGSASKTLYTKSNVSQPCNQVAQHIAKFNAE